MRPFNLAAPTIWVRRFVARSHEPAGTRFAPFEASELLTVPSSAAKVW